MATTSSVKKKKRTPEEIERIRKKRKLRERREAEEAAAASKKSTNSSKSEKTAKKKRGLNLAGYREEMADLNTREGDFFKLDEPGKYRVRFMPNPSNDGFFTKYAVRTWLDTLTSGGETSRRPYYSPRSLDKSAYCPATAAHKALAELADTRKKDKELKKQVDDARPERFYLANALVFDKATKKWKQVVLYMTPKLFENVIDKQLALAGEDDDLEELDGMGIADIKTGRKVLIERKGMKLDTKWSVTVLDDTLPLTREQLDARVDLDDVVKPTDAESLEELVCEQYGVNDISELSKGSKSKKRDDSSARKKKKKAADIIEDDEEDSDDDDDDDVVPLDDDDEEEDDEDDDDLDDDDDEDDEEDDEEDDDDEDDDDEDDD